METNSLLITLAIGAISGWLAGIISRGGGFGLLGNIVVGIVGAVVGGYLFQWLGISVASGWVGSIITATAGAVVLLFLIRLVKRA